MSDARGIFDIPCNLSGEIYLRAQAKGYSDAELGPFTLQPDAALTNLRLELGHGGQLEGRILVPAGMQAAGIVLFASRGDGFAERFITDSAGAFRLEHLTPGAWLVRMFDENPGTGLTTITMQPHGDLPWNCTVVEGATTHFDFDMNSRALLRGRLTGLEAWPGWSAELDENGAIYRTDWHELQSDGEFIVRGQEPGDYTLHLHAKLESATAIIDAPMKLHGGENTWSTSIKFGELTVSSTGRKTHQLQGDLGNGLRAIVFFNLDERGNCRLSPLPAGTWSVPSSEDGAKDGDSTANASVVSGGRAVLAVP